MPIALLYHDVTARGQDAASGFPGPGAARYKLTPQNFRAHLDAVAAVVAAPPIIADPSIQFESPAAWLLTFDDGGVSSLAPIADMLEEKGWRGHFFISTDFIDAPTFLTKQQIRDLRRRGHVIGSHSCSHPARFSMCPWEQLLREWGQSKAVLEDILGEEVSSASVPGGFYSKVVAKAAAQAGLTLLFNSEPTTRVIAVDRCLIVGRYSIVRDTAPQTAARLVQGRLGPRLRQSVAWKLKKIAKATGGTGYLRLREWWLRRTQRNLPD